MRKIILGIVAMFTFTGGAMVAQGAGVAEAKLTNCSKWTSGVQGYGQCSGRNDFIGYNMNQVVVVVICRRPTWLGGGSYQLAGNWVGINGTSIATCATFYNATDPVLWFR